MAENLLNYFVKGGNIKVYILYISTQLNFCIPLILHKYIYIVSVPIFGLLLIYVHGKWIIMM